MPIWDTIKDALNPIDGERPLMDAIAPNLSNAYGNVQDSLVNIVSAPFDADPTTTVANQTGDFIGGVFNSVGSFISGGSTGNQGGSAPIGSTPPAGMTCKPTDCYTACRERDLELQKRCKALNDAWVLKMKEIGCTGTKCSMKSIAKTCSKRKTKAKCPRSSCSTISSRSSRSSCR